MATRASAQQTLIDVTDAYNAVLTSDSYTFVGNTSGVASGQSCSTDAVVFQGSTQLTAVAVTADNITYTASDGSTVTGISATVTNNSSSQVTITFTTTATIKVAVVADIPIVADGLTFHKKFSMAVAKTGATGTGVKSVKPQYYLSTSSSSATGGSWADTPQTYSSGHYYWTRMYITYTSGTTATTTAVLDKGLNSANETALAAQESANATASDLATKVTELNSDIEDLQTQIDGGITNWFYDGEPTLENEPASTWTTDKEKSVHVGDIYYDNNTGYAYRFKGETASDGTVTYSWIRITDSDVTKALADAQAAQDTADSKRRVFYTTPTPPYDQGDLWVQGSSGDIMRCQTAKASGGTYASSDWVKASKYTDNTVANANVKTTEVQYYLSTSTTALSGGSWSSTAPEWVDGKYMWSRTKITTAGGTTSYSPSETGTCIAGATGATGEQGEAAIAMTITASEGTVFKNNSGSTILTAHVFVGGVEQTITASTGVCGNYGTVKWYKGTSTTAAASASTYTVSASDVESALAITAKLEK